MSELSRVPTGKESVFTEHAIVVRIVPEVELASATVSGAAEVQLASATVPDVPDVQLAPGTVPGDPKDQLASATVPDVPKDQLASATVADVSEFTLALATVPDVSVVQLAPGTVPDDPKDKLASATVPGISEVQLASVVVVAASLSSAPELNEDDNTAVSDEDIADVDAVQVVACDESVASNVLVAVADSEKSYQKLLLMLDQKNMYVDRCTYNPSVCPLIIVLMTNLYIFLYLAKISFYNSHLIEDLSKCLDYPCLYI